MSYQPFDFGPVFESALSYEDYLDQHGDAGDRNRWQTVLDSVQLTSEQTQLLKSFVREMRVLCLAGAWCGDCVAQCPIWKRFADATSKIDLRFVDRDANADLAAELKICGGTRVPQLVILSELNLPVVRLGERTLSKFRALGSELLGHPRTTTDTSIITQEWIEEFERAQYVLRLSPSLRERHGD